MESAGMRLLPESTALFRGFVAAIMKSRGRILRMKSQNIGNKEVLILVSSWPFVMDIKLPA